LSGPVCYVERTASGALIRAVRLVGDRLDRVWSPPAPRGGEAPEPGEIIDSTRAAARWVAQQLPSRGPKSLSGVCVDVDGGLCLWLSAPSSDPSVVAAAMAHGRGADDGGTSEGGGDAGLLALAAAGVGMERSVQALDALGAGPRGRAAKATGERRRMAVLSVPDLTIRVFLDELDALGVAVDAVSTLWHAMAAAWDPDRRRAGGRSLADDGLADSPPQCSAIILLDPGAGAGREEGEGSPACGRLIWSWAAGGELVAGGSMRLRTVAAPSAPGDEHGNGEAFEGVRRIESAREGERTAVCGEPEVGRLIADWLAWSVQLGLGPSRILCVGPMPATESAGPGLMELLARGWNGAAVDAAVHHDPVGATLERVRDDAGVEPERIASDPRASLVTLSHRPGRAHRRMYHWAAAALAVAALAVGALGWRLGNAAEEANQTVSKMRADLTASLSGLATIAPNLATPAGMADPEAVLRATLASLQQSRPRLDREEPILAELDRLMRAMAIEDVNPEMKLDELFLSSLSGSVRLLLPPDDGVTGQIITAELGKIPGLIDWTGSSSSSSSSMNRDNRVWNLSGVWVPHSSRREADRVASGGGIRP